MVSKSDKRVLRGYRGYLILSVIVLSAANLGCWKKSSVEMPKAVIHGGSMAPTFLGEHFVIKCEECKFSFAVDANEVPNHSTATCPNCGYSENEYPDTGAKPSTRIRLDDAEGTYGRWDVLAFQFSDSKKNGIKRLVGLPGDEVAVVDGDIWVNGALAHRNMSIKKQMRVLHYDSDFTTSSGPIRLTKYSIGEDESSAMEISNLNDWEETDDQWWLAFRPINCFRGATNRAPVATIRDNYGFNQAVSRGTLNDTQQLMVETELELGDGDEFTIYIRYANDMIGFCVDRKLNEVRISQNNVVLARSRFDFAKELSSVLAFYGGRRVPAAH